MMLIEQNRQNWTGSTGAAPHQSTEHQWMVILQQETKNSASFSFQHEIILNQQKTDTQNSELNRFLRFTLFILEVYDSVHFAEEVMCL